MRRRLLAVQPRGDRQCVSDVAEWGAQNVPAAAWVCSDRGGVPGRSAGSVTAAPAGLIFDDASEGSPSQTFAPVADPFVNAGAPRSSFGAAKGLCVAMGPVKHGLLRFNISGPQGEIASARLWLDPMDAGPGGLDVRNLASGNWSEATTWSTAPRLGAAVPAIVHSSAATNGTSQDHLISIADAYNGVTERNLLANAENGRGITLGRHLIRPTSSAYYNASGQLVFGHLAVATNERHVIAARDTSPVHRRARCRA